MRHLRSRPALLDRGRNKGAVTRTYVRSIISALYSVCINRRILEANSVTHKQIWKLFTQRDSKSSECLSQFFFSLSIIGSIFWAVGVERGLHVLSAAKNSVSVAANWLYLVDPEQSVGRYHQSILAFHRYFRICVYFCLRWKLFLERLQRKKRCSTSEDNCKISSITYLVFVCISADSVSKKNFKISNWGYVLIRKLLTDVRSGLIFS